MLKNATEKVQVTLGMINSKRVAKLVICPRMTIENALDGA